MRIGIDIDGVLTNLEQFTMDYLSKYCVENNIEFNIGNSNYSAAKTFHIDDKQEDDFWDEYLMYYATNEKVRPFASEVIRKLKENGHEIYILTARWLTNREDENGERMRKTVKEWLIESDIVYDKLIFSQAKNEQKIQEIIEYKIDLMIEDSPKNIMDISNIIPVICYHAEYNKNCISDKIIRCYSWYDIYNKIYNLELNKENKE